MTLCLSKVKPKFEAPALSFFYLDVCGGLDCVCVFFLSQGGYRDVMKLADNFSAFNQRLKYAHYRPSVSVKSDARSWWNYAFRVVSEQIKIARYRIRNIHFCRLATAVFLYNLHSFWKPFPCGS